MALSLLNRVAGGGGPRLEDEVFCVTQERDFFKSRYLEQVSEISSLQKDLERARKEIARLRNEVLNTTVTTEDTSLLEQSFGVTPEEEERRRLSNMTLEVRQPEASTSEEEDDDADGEDQYGEDQDQYNDDEESDHEAEDIRNNAAKLLQWANYRQSMSPSKPLSSASSLQPDDAATLDDTLEDEDSESELDEDDDSRLE